ncbi:hypothetical protein [Clostridium sp. YIM B02551]|uniref:hypothetical protein n=1 Tax=Clostridium sp. YIM B02551 TaxID=2910679 RepID=UPI001EE9DBBE|nr:hypothetical protein [Clostridium sp. YIM B02551]
MGVSFAQDGGDFLYNVVRVDIEELDSTTFDVKTDGKKIKIDCDSEIGLDPQINEGKKNTLRDSKKILAQAEDEDLLEALGLKLTSVKFPVQAMPLVQGGTIRYDEADPNKIVGYDAATMAEGVANKRFLKVTAYVENYEGEAVLNYVKFTFWKCKGTPIKFDLKKEFFAPEFNLTAKENSKLKKPIYSIDYVDLLPA